MINYICITATVLEESSKIQTSTSEVRTMIHPSRGQSATLLSEHDRDEPILRACVAHGGEVPPSKPERSAAAGQDGPYP